jgi:hypothetical protein
MVPTAQRKRRGHRKDGKVGRIGSRRDRRRFDVVETF